MNTIENFGKNEPYYRAMGDEIDIFEATKSSAGYAKRQVNYLDLAIRRLSHILKEMEEKYEY